MQFWRMADIVQVTQATLVQGDPQEPLRGVSIDSRTIQPGELFVALRGERFDGHRFVVAALQRGARAVMVSEALDAPGQSVPESRGVIQVADTLVALQDMARAYRLRWSGTLVALTGSSGKTTVKELSAAVLATRLPTYKAPGNLNNHIGLPLALLRLQPEHQVGVFELGMNHLGEIRHLCTIARPHLGLVTNIGLAHVGYLGSIERIQEAKGELIESLAPDGVAIVNADDPLALALRRHARGRVVTFGESEEADVRGWLLEDRGLQGIRVQLRIQQEVREIALDLPGAHNLSNALAAAAVGLVLQVPVDHMVTGLQSYQGMYGRLMIRPGRRGIIIIDDTYNANPQSMRAALHVLARTPTDGARLAVLGDMLELGDMAAALHQDVGRLAASCNVQHLVACGPLARYIAQGARDGGMPAARVHAVDEQQDVLRLLDELCRPGDVLLLKGSRGMAMERLVAALGESEGEA